MAALPPLRLEPPPVAVPPLARVPPEVMLPPMFWDPFALEVPPVTLTPPDASVPPAALAPPLAVTPPEERAAPPSEAPPWFALPPVTDATPPFCLESLDVEPLHAATAVMVSNARATERFSMGLIGLAQRKIPATHTRTAKAVMRKTQTNGTILSRNWHFLPPISREPRVGRPKL